VTLEALEAMAEPLRDAALLPARVLVDHLPRLAVSGEVARRFLQGQPAGADAQMDGQVAVFEADALLGVADVTEGLAHPRRVVADAQSNPGGKSALSLTE
jgi:tRNA pseudouridine55 synthase